MLVLSEISYAWSLPFFSRNKQPPPAVIKKEGRKSKVQLTAKENYTVLFYLTGDRELRLQDSGKRKTWLELNYKIVNGSKNRAPLFSLEGLAEVWFLDKKGELVIGDEINFQEMIAGEEYFGSVWVPKKAAKKIKGAYVRPKLADTFTPYRPPEETPEERARREALKREQEAEAARKLAAQKFRYTNEMVEEILESETPSLDISRLSSPEPEEIEAPQELKETENLGVISEAELLPEDAEAPSEDPSS